MKYFLDTEFNGFGGELLSLAMVREDNESIYIVYPEPKKIDLWVKENVMPHMWSIPKTFPGKAVQVESHIEGTRLIQSFFNGWGFPGYEDKGIPYVISDWPDDIQYLCKALITAPGEMINIPRIQFDVVRVNAYPTEIKNAVQHNAFWDAKALKHILIGN